jgi:hypothetical protein
MESLVVVKERLAKMNMQKNRMRKGLVSGGALLVGTLCFYVLGVRHGGAPNASSNALPAQDVSVVAQEDHHQETQRQGPAGMSVSPLVPEHAAAPEDPAEPGKKLDRSRAFVGTAMGWLSQRRSEAERASRTQEVVALTVRIERLAPRLRALQEGRDPDEASVSGQPIPR